ncbi:unnamed protein product [Spirodela intermedia]|uniref:Uncharacterized protein n=1 Tax=Spirodela intermedia TaxID=51605 RepID=A0A7I8LEH3_SPIIN|nr:unnamed protein product [Spirodela intermedia]
MCIAAWVWEAHPLYRLLLVFNRDELHDRPTEPVEWWGDGGRKILGGRDGLAGGTWLGCTRNGRIAFLTNVRETCSLPVPKSRGDIPVKFLEGEMSPIEFAEEVVEQGDLYNGFNLVLADLRSKSMVFATNRGPVAIELVSPGLHFLSNGSLDSPWPKCQRLGKGLEELLDKHCAKEVPTNQVVEQLMRDTTKANRGQLPDTGYGSDVEFEVSSIFVDAELDMGHYRTRSIYVVAVRGNMSVSIFEEFLDGESWKQMQVEYQIEESEK